MVVLGGIRGPPTLRRSGLVGSGRNVLKVRVGNVVTLASVLDGTLHVGIFGEVNFLKSVWNQVEKELREKLRQNPRDLRRGWDQVRRGSLKNRVTSKSACFPQGNSHQCNSRHILRRRLQDPGS